ncbi:MAG: YiiX/YebB-like N1pC/P60 family cysteine hydrolase [Phormidesmis sp.]
MSNRRPENRSVNLLIRSAFMVMLIVFAYSLQLFNNGRRRGQMSQLLPPALSTSLGVSETRWQKSMLFWSRALQNQVLQNETVQDDSLQSRSLQRRSPSQHQFQNGDIIFRSSNTWLTNVAGQFASPLTYSHVGIVTVDGAQMTVVHASIEGDSIAQTLGNPVIEEPLADFLKRGNATHAAIYRLKDATTKTQRAIAKAAHAYAKAAIPFDSGFDLATADRVYCSELIWRVYLESGIDLADQGLESFDFPFSGQYLTPDSLAESVSLTPVYQFNQIRSARSSY